MRLHDKGAKADRDRALLVASYNAMCKEFHTPITKRLTPVDIAKMTNTQLYQASKDLYNGQPLKKAKKLSHKMGLSEKPESWLMRMWRAWTMTPTLQGIHVIHNDESHSHVREAQRG